MPHRSYASHLPNALLLWCAEKRRVISYLRLKAKNLCQLLHTNCRGSVGRRRRRALSDSFKKTKLLSSSALGSTFYALDPLSDIRWTILELDAAGLAAGDKSYG